MEVQNRYNRIPEEGYRDDFGTLVFSHAQIEFTIEQGCVYEGSFMVDATPGSITSAFITTSDVRMECKTPNINGNHEEVYFCFHGENLESGQVIKGKFFIISNHGEYTVPFTATVVKTYIETSVGPVKNLFHFTNLAKTDWNEALKFFYSPDFKEILDDRDRMLSDAYKALSRGTMNEQHMEEFLIQVRKKQPVEYIPGENYIELKMAWEQIDEEVYERELQLSRNGWGYTSLNIECDGDFLFTEKSLLTDDDFLGNKCTLPLYIDGGSLRPGNNFGRIVLYNCYTELNIRVVVKVETDAKGRQKYFQVKRAVIQLMELYQAFRMKQISTAVWLKDSGQLVDRMLRYNEDDIGAHLFQAHLLITEGKMNEAKWHLSHAMDLLEELKEDDWELYAYYLYLGTLMDREEEHVNEVAKQVKKIYQRECNSWKIAWLLLFLAPEYQGAGALKWELLKEQFENGCTSFVIYTEALIVLNNNPALLRTLAPFELQVLHYAVKNNALSREVMNQLLYLCHKVREYDAFLCNLLEELYDKTGENLLLQEICTLLIKGAVTGRKAFKWYELGVERQLRITNLYEYYMMSLDLNVPNTLPKMVLLYFSYQSNLDYEKLAFLYRYVWEHKGELGEIYSHYEPRIKRFVKDQIEKEHINRDLAVLYNKFVDQEMLTKPLAATMTRLLFAHVMNISDTRIRRVYVSYPDFEESRSFAVADGICRLTLYGTEYTITMEDAYGNLFMQTKEYDLEKLMSVPGLLPACVSYGCDIPELLLYMYHRRLENEPLDQENVQMIFRLATMPEISLDLRRELNMKLLNYFYDRDMEDAFDDCFSHIRPEEYTVTDRAQLVKYMVLRGQYEEALSWISYYDPYFVDVKTLVRLISALGTEDVSENEIITQTAIYVFRKGKYNGAVLSYLARFYEGTSRELRDLWKTAVEFGTDAYTLSERILMQILYTGAYVGDQNEIFRYYVSGGSKQEVENAYLSQCAYDYFVKEKLTDDYVFRRIGLMFGRGEEVGRILKLAYLKYYSENDSEDRKEITSAINSWVKDFITERIHLDFFRKLPCEKDILKEMTDKTIVEYRGRPGSRARIHYMILNEEGEAQEYQNDYMTDVFGGVFFKEFVLFFGETLQYYIMEEYGETQQLTKSGSLSHNDIGFESGNSRFELINEMVIGKNLKDFRAFEDALHRIRRQEFINQELFHLK